MDPNQYSALLTMSGYVPVFNSFTPFRGFMSMKYDNKGWRQMEQNEVPIKVITQYSYNEGLVLNAKYMSLYLPISYL